MEEKQLLKIKKLKNQNLRNIQNVQNNKISYFKDKIIHINYLENNLIKIKKSPLTSLETVKLQIQELNIQQRKNNFNSNSTTAFFDGEGILRNNR